MKVLQINSVCGRGSTGRIVSDISRVLQKEGHECLVAYGRYDAPDKIPSIKISDTLDTSLHGICSRIFDNAGFWSVKATKKAIKKFEEYDPDVIHLHNVHGYYINVELLFDYLKRAGKPVVWTLHDCWAFTGHCAYFDAYGCEKWKSGCSDCGQKHTYPQTLIADRSKHNYLKKREIFTGVNNLTLVTPSKWLKGITKDSFLSEYKCEVIPNGIDTDIFQPCKSDFRKKYGLEDKYIILGVASVWEERKGLNDFIKLSEMLSDEYRIVLVGLNKEQISKLPENVMGIERTDSAKELAEVYSAADVYLNTTYEDNYPTTNLEARACGTPVITYETGGSPESAGVDAVIVKKGDLNGVLKSLAERHTLSAEKLKSKEEMARDYMDLYLKVRGER